MEMYATRPGPSKTRIFFALSENCRCYVHQILATCRVHRALAMGKFWANTSKAFWGGMRGIFSFDPHVSPQGSWGTEIFFPTGLGGGRVPAKFQRPKIIWGWGKGSINFSHFSVTNFKLFSLETFVSDRSASCTKSLAIGSHTSQAT